MRVILNIYYTMQPCIVCAMRSREWVRSPVRMDMNILLKSVGWEMIQAISCHAMRMHTRKGKERRRLARTMKSGRKIHDKFSTRPFNAERIMTHFTKIDRIDGGFFFFLKWTECNVYVIWSMIIRPDRLIKDWKMIWQLVRVFNLLRMAAICRLKEICTLYSQIAVNK